MGSRHLSDSCTSTAMQREELQMPKRKERYFYRCRRCQGELGLYSGSTLSRHLDTKAPQFQCVLVERMRVQYTKRSLAVLSQ